MSGRDGWSQEAKDRAARAHADHAYCCACGRIVHGNGGRVGHFIARNGSPRVGHTEIFYRQWLALPRTQREAVNGREFAE